MPDTILQQKIFPYDGQQDSTRHPLLISPSDVVDSDNIIYTTYSTKKKRPGISPVFTSRPAGNKPIIGSVDFWRQGVQRIVYFQGGRIKAVNWLGQVDDITGNFILPTNETVTFVTFQGFLAIFFSGGQIAPKAWVGSGSIFDLSPTAPNAPFGKVWLNRMWIPDPNFPGRMLYSSTGDPTDFAGGDSGAIDLDVADGDPDGITAIFPPFFQSLYVAKRFSIYKISTVTFNSSTDTQIVFFSQAKITDGVGCNSHNAVRAIESNIFFTSDRGVHTMNSTNQISGIDTQFLSNVIQPQWVNDVNFPRSKFMQSVYDVELNSYLLIFPSSGRNLPSDVWGYSVQSGKWYRWRDYSHTAICTYLDFVDRRPKTLVCSDQGDFGFIDKNVNKDYGKDYSLWIQSGIIAPAGTPDDSFSFQAIAPIFVPQPTGKFTISYKVDSRTIDTLEFDLTSNEGGDELAVDFIPGVSVLGGLPEVKMDKRNISGYGMLYSMFIEHTPQSNSDEAESFELLGVLVDVDRVQKTTGEVSA